MNSSIEGYSGPNAGRQNRQLFFLACAGLVAALVFYGISANVVDPLHRYQGLIILFLSAWPGIDWARKAEKPFPAFEVFCLTNANIFALPLLNGHEALATYSASTISSASWAVIIYQTALIATHQTVGGFPGKSAFWTEPIFADRVMNYMSYGLVVSSAYSIISTFSPEIIPYELNSIVRAVCFGIGIVCTFLSARLWGLNRLRTVEKLFTAVSLAVQVLAQIATLYLIQGISVLLLFVIGYVVGSRRLPVVFLAACLATVAVLHNGKSDMRLKYWSEDGRIIPKLSEAPAFMEEWILDGLNAGSADAGQRDIAAKLVDRTSLFHIMCLVVDMTPDRRPFMAGETYGYIPAQFVPRIFWPDKPLAHAATYRLSIYFGLQNEADTQTTSIGFGMLTEAYANFGIWGVILLGCVQGAFLKKVRVWTRNSPMVSYGGILQVLLMAWVFQTEYTAAAWISSFYQACVSVLGIPFVIRSLFG